MMIGVNHRGSFKKLETFLHAVKKDRLFSDLHEYGRRGVAALATATPTDSGITANSWEYRIVNGRKPTIQWYNTNVNDGANVAILIQYGHGTGTGGYVQGIDYINPAIQPIFDKISNDIWKRVTRA